MNWQQQFEEMMAGWTDTQRRMWDNWVEAIGSFEGTGQENEAWRREYERNLEVWEQSVREALNAQANWVQNWGDSLLENQQAPEPMIQWVNQAQEMMGRWTEAQSQLWNAWFESVRQMEPGQGGSPWAHDGDQVLKAWQEAAQRSQEALSDWSRHLGDAEVARQPPPAAADPAPAANSATAAPQAAASRPAPKSAGGATRSRADSTRKSAGASRSGTPRSGGGSKSGSS